MGCKNSKTSNNKAAGGKVAPATGIAVDPQPDMAPSTPVTPETPPTVRSVAMSDGDSSDMTPPPGEKPSPEHISLPQPGTKPSPIPLTLQLQVDGKPWDAQCAIVNDATSPQAKMTRIPVVAL